MFYFICKYFNLFTTLCLKSTIFTWKHIKQYNCKWKEKLYIWNRVARHSCFQHRSLYHPYPYTLLNATTHPSTQPSVLIRWNHPILMTLCATKCSNSGWRYLWFVCCVLLCLLASKHLPAPPDQLYCTSITFRQTKYYTKQKYRQFSVLNYSWNGFWASTY